jgi:hypothetical protein
VLYSGKEVDARITAIARETLSPDRRATALLFQFSLSRAQRQQAGITGDLATRKISSNASVSVEGKGKLWYITRWHVLGAPKENAGFAKTQCSSIF